MGPVYAVGRRTTPVRVAQLQKGEAKTLAQKARASQANPKRAEKPFRRRLLRAAPPLRLGRRPNPAAMAVPAANGVEVEEGGGEQQEGAVRAPRPPLAVEALRDKIVEKVKANRVTLIVGDTGCGKCLSFPLWMVSTGVACVCCNLWVRLFAVVIPLWGFVEALTGGCNFSRFYLPVVLLDICYTAV